MMDGVCNLIALVPTKDEEGYETFVEQKTEVYCNWSEGVSQNEFYLANKSGFQASATVDVFASDYEKQGLVDFEGVRYRVIRMFQRKLDYVTLVLEEVVK